jgi:hypothetical protein
MNPYISDVLKGIDSVGKKYNGFILILYGPVDEINVILSEKFAKIIQKVIVTKGKCCERCGISHPHAEMQRCHAGRTRPEIAKEAILTAERDEKGGRYVSSIMINFISLHLNEPIKFMCEPCHREFDRKKLVVPKRPAEKKLVPKPKSPVVPTTPSIDTLAKRSDPVPGRVNCKYRHLGCMSQLKNKNTMYSHVSRDCKFKPTSCGGGSGYPGADRTTS